MGIKQQVKLYISVVFEVCEVTLFLSPHARVGSVGSLLYFLCLARVRGVRGLFHFLPFSLVLEVLEVGTFRCV